MPGAFVIFLKAICDRIVASNFDASRKQKHAGGIPEHGSHVVHVMCVLCGYELRKESSRLVLVRRSRCAPAYRNCHYDKTEHGPKRKMAHCRTWYRSIATVAEFMELVMLTSLRFNAGLGGRV
jgi:phosphoribosylaminoimidazole carboxylase (NCAIR synthetase)